jgi:hypothetical protein
MKKIFLSIIAAAGLLSNSAKGQEVIAQATLRPDGSQIIQRTDLAGHVSTIIVSKGETINSKNIESLQTQPASSSATSVQQSSWISHQAVIGKDGNQEIHLSDASGHLTIISANNAESLQKKYLEHLAKTGTPCGCSNPASVAQSPKTATRPLEPEGIKK